MAGIRAQLRHAWNAFTNQEDKPFAPDPYKIGAGYYGARPDRTRLRITNERSMITSIYNRIAIDAAAIDIEHVILDEDKRYVSTVQSGLNNCLTVQANEDQEASDFRQDVFMSMCDWGAIAIVPVDTTLDPTVTGGYDVKTMRVGEVVQWYPKHVKVSVYNVERGLRQEITLEKSFVAIVQNPLYAVMNQQNSTLQRLISKLNLLDAVDTQSASGKLDIIIQLPYVAKSETKRAQAEQRRTDMETQLQGSKYGIAYTDATEKITQLNRPAENNLLEQVKYLTEMLYGQLGLTPDIMNGTADEKAMINYYNRTIEPFVRAVAEAMKAKFLTKTARTQLQSIAYFRDPFKLIPVATLSEVADKFTRNEILTANEFRGIIGFRPSKDPKADELRNSNVPAPSEPAIPQDSVQEGDSQNGT